LSESGKGKISLVPSKQSREFLAAASAAYMDQLANANHAQDYLKNRGLSADRQAFFKLGYVNDPLPGHESYAGRIAIPYVTRSGVVGFKFRSLSEGKDKFKYLYPTGQATSIFNPEAFFHPRPYIAVCEGEIDTMTAHGRMLPAVGFPGAKAIKPWFWKPLAGYDAVYILADGDDNGESMAWANHIAEYVENTRIIPMPTGHDVNSFVTENGYDALLDKIGISK
jgi:DNA primase